MTQLLIIVLRGLRFLFRMLQTAQYLSWVVHQTIVRVFNRYLFLMKDIFHVSSDKKYIYIPCIYVYTGIL